MSRTWFLLTLAITACALQTSAVAGERRLRQPRSSFGHHQGNSTPAYGPVPRTNGLPYGRAYYGGRYFGNFNNRFYGPQYGYF